MTHINHKIHTSDLFLKIMKNTNIPIIIHQSSNFTSDWQRRMKINIRRRNKLQYKKRIHFNRQFPNASMPHKSKSIKNNPQFASIILHILRFLVKPKVKKPILSLKTPLQLGLVAFYITKLSQITLNQPLFEKNPTNQIFKLIWLSKRRIKDETLCLNNFIHQITFINITKIKNKLIYSQLDRL